MVSMSPPICSPFPTLSTQHCPGRHAGAPAPVTVMVVSGPLARWLYGQSCGTGVTSVYCLAPGGTNIFPELGGSCGTAQVLSLVVDLHPDFTPELQSYCSSRKGGHKGSKMLWGSPGASRSSKSFVVKTTSDVMGKASAKSYPSCSSKCTDQTC